LKSQKVESSKHKVTRRGRKIKEETKSEIRKGQLAEKVGGGRQWTRELRMKKSEEKEMNRGRHAHTNNSTP
jgi:hypothetical protein